jgi:hypothetical protein
MRSFRGKMLAPLAAICFFKKRQICIEKHSEVKIDFFGAKDIFPTSAFLARHTCVCLDTPVLGG